MAKIILLNDVECEMDQSDVVVGPSDSPLTDKGVLQAVQISKFMPSIQPVFDVIIASDSKRVTKLLHQIRLQVKIKQTKVRYSGSLSERSFGVLNGTKFIGGLKSDVFRHSRVCAEGGESVAQCAERSMRFIRGILAENGVKNTLCVTHPFLAQIICNTMCNKKTTILTPFWFNKGALMEATIVSDGFKPKTFWNCIEVKKFNQETVYYEDI